jgi:hypothetical protein
MDNADYFAMVVAALKEVQTLQEQREAVEAEITKQEQLISALSNFLTDEQKAPVLDKLRINQELQRVRELGLTESVRTVLNATNEWLTATQVRDKLVDLGFNFSTYTSNPLSSVSTTLRRIRQEEVDFKTNSDGVAIYRWRHASLGDPPRPPKRGELLIEAVTLGKK